ncbi:histidine kinase [Brachybacterium sp. UMB0905]|nr:histidine kinase [Brachybacterium sp. UMB0905]
MTPMSTDSPWGSWARGGEEEAAARPLTPRGIWRAMRQSGGLPFSAPPLVFVLLAIVTSWLGLGPLRATLASVILLIYSAVFLAVCGIALYPLRVRLIWFALGTALLLALIPLLGSGVLYLVMFQAMTHVLLLPWRWGLPSMLVMCLVVMLLAIILQHYIAAGLAIMAALFAAGIGTGVRQEVLQQQLEAAEARNAVLAVAAERERIGRDLHDLVGHSLTSLTISAQLARRLLDIDPEAAKAQLEHIEATTRQALADVRATASGMQHVRAATEIASARTVLATVGIQASVPTALPPLPDDVAELFGYVIREGVTNIVRHSRATCATITVTEDTVTVSDDGVGIPAGATRTGLRGLEARLAMAGGRLTVTSAETGTTLTARVGAA